MNANHSPFFYASVIISLFKILDISLDARWKFPQRRSRFFTIIINVVTGFVLIKPKAIANLSPRWIKAPSFRSSKVWGTNTVSSKRLASIYLSHPEFYKYFPSVDHGTNHQKGSHARHTINLYRGATSNFLFIPLSFTQTHTYLVFCPSLRDSYTLLRGTYPWIVRLWLVRQYILLFFLFPFLVYSFYLFFQIILFLWKWKIEGTIRQ